MRLSLLLALAIVAASAAPTAMAARADLVLTAPEEAVQAEGVVPIDVSLTLSDFMCSQPYAITVELAVNATAGVQATLSAPNVTFEVPADGYFVRSYQSNATVQIAVTAGQAGTVELVAAFAGGDGEPCFAPGGFEPATATVAIRVDAAGTTPTPATNETPTLNETSTNESATNETNTTANTTPKTPTPRGNSSAPSCGPEGNCGAIGEYVPPEESAGADTPGVGFLLGAAVLGIAALVWRRRKP